RWPRRVSRLVPEVPGFHFHPVDTPFARARLDGRPRMDLRWVHSFPGNHLGSSAAFASGRVPASEGAIHRRSPAMPLTDLPFATMTELGEAYRSRKLSPVEVTKVMLERIEKLDSRLHSYVTVTPEIALEQAKKAEADLAAGKDRGPMHGIPVGLKDLCETKGVPTTWGTKILRNYVPDADGTVVRNLQEAGSIMLGKVQ